ncbi:MAG: 2-hydroxyacyl-CoA dehydratase family protein [Parasphingorhabdus sp.]|uniref:2-hydroxyacyl-CoA dehydratase subunit D n=1 Tax=Parasphingorhabdus sp. TaxID=2709688 RepID=UPI0030032C6D
MDPTGQADKIFAALAGIAEDPLSYAEEWKRKTGRQVIAVLPMNFPSELIHAAGALPVVMQAERTAPTDGRSLLYEYYCGFTRSLVDQAATKKLGVFDAFLLVDHCVALLGAADAIRFELPDTPVHLAQYTASMDEPWTPPQVQGKVDELKGVLSEICGRSATDEGIIKSINAFNLNRKMLREIYDLRRSGEVPLTSRKIQVLVKSSMVMDIAEHNEHLAQLLPMLKAGSYTSNKPVKLHLSGHFCHAPHPELLDMIEDCGAVIVDDDLYTGYRYIATDVPTERDPIAALTRWYFDRNTNTPCSTRAQKNVDWEKYLSTSAQKSGAEGIIVLMAKFCEPHMLYYPELRKEFIAANIPHLLLETEHESPAIEMVKTRVEALIETIRLNKTKAA